MRFVGIRLNEPRLPLRRSIKRLIGLGLSVITFGLGFLGIVFGERRRELADASPAPTSIYDDRRPEPAPWSRPESATAGTEPLDGPAPVEPQTAVPSGPSASL